MVLDRISIADLIQGEDAEKIDTSYLEGDAGTAHANTREEIFKLLEMGKGDKSIPRDKHSFYQLTPKTELEKSINKILNKTEEEDVSTVRANRTFKYEFDSKMRRIKRIKSKAYRRVRRAAKLKNEQVTEKVDMVCVEDGDRDARSSRIPDTLLREIETCEKESTPVLSFGGPGESHSNVQEELVKLAFNEDIEENEKVFVKEKEEVVNSEAPKVEEVVLPGWGDWAGPGLELTRTKENTTVNFVDGIKYSKRKDFNRSHVIINENTPNVAKKFQTELPFGYTEEEYNAKITTSVSKEWNTLRIFKKLVRTKTNLVNGCVIEPFRYEPGN